MTDFTYDLGADGVALITWDVPNKSMNVMSLEGFALLDSLIDKALADDAVKGVVITSGKKDFAGGMDLNVIAKMRDEDGAKGLYEGVMRMHGILRKIERAGMDPKTLKGGKPIASALPGTALGIGLELPLSTHRIFAAENPKAKIGLPEIMVGIFPGAGGTTRLSRKLGAMMAAPFLLEGKLSDPKSAKAAGIIDEVVAEGEQVPEFDIHASLVSLPHLCRVDFAALSAEPPYLRAPEESRIKLGRRERAKRSWRPRRRRGHAPC